LYGAQENDVFYWLGCAYEQLKEVEEAQRCFKIASTGLSEPNSAMFYNDQQPDKIFYQGMAWIKLGEHDKAQTVFNRLVTYGKEHRHDEITLDYFAVSLPNLLIFDDDLSLRNKLHCDYITGLGLLGLSNITEAHTLFKNVLKEDAMHSGAKTHLDLLYAAKAGDIIKQQRI
jgi:tetratricopeptide (TPR) repeat protein